MSHPMSRRLSCLMALGVALSAGLFAGSATADDMFNSSAPMAAWQGAYVGAHGGLGLGTSGNLSTGGTAFGMHGGYNFQSQQFVGGGELDLTASQIKNSATSESFTQRWMTTGRARGGFAFSSMLAYGTVGLALGGTNYSAGSYSTDSFNFGYVYGAGLESMVMPHVALRGEVLHYDLGSANYLNSSGASQLFKTTSDIVRFGVDYKF